MLCLVKNEFCFIVADFKAEIIGFMAKVDDKLKTLNGDIEHLHYLVNRGLSKESAGASQDLESQRVTDYIPCHTYDELKELNRKMDDKAFFSHCVSQIMCYVFFQDCIA